jgi:hypothetical protein
LWLHRHEKIAAVWANNSSQLTSHGGSGQVPARCKHACAARLQVGFNNT